MSQPETAQEPVTGQAEASIADVPATDNVDTLPSVEEQLKTLELKVAEHHDAWLRADAEEAMKLVTQYPASELVAERTDEPWFARKAKPAEDRTLI